MFLYVNILYKSFYPYFLDKNIPEINDLVVILKYSVIAVDFDGTIVNNEYPQIGELIPAAKKTLTKFKDNGGYIIIWTCRTGKLLREAVEFLRYEGIPFDTINENIPHRIKEYGTDPRKVGADLYIDDKSPGGVDWELIAKMLGVD